jgi:hypothetical protein
VAGVPGAFWNEAMETLSPVDARRLEDVRLVEQIAYDHATSPFYRARLDSAGVRPDDVRHVEDLARIPFMEKREIAESQAVIFNSRLDAVVCGIFLVLVTTILIDSLRVWVGILRGTREATVSEAPFVPSALQVEEL